MFTFNEKSCLNKEEEIWSMSTQRFKFVCVCVYIRIYMGGSGERER